MPIEIINLKKANDIFSAIDDLYESLGDNFNLLWWRGHADFTWKLLPSVYRPQFLNHEPWLIQDFMRRAKTRYQFCPSENAWPDWLILMQHYGLPTRMLDWSESVFVAAYFAVSEHEERDGAIWVMNPYNFNYYENNTQRIVDCYEEIVVGEFEKAFKSVSRSGEIVAVQMPENHIRMLVQRAAFTVHGNETPIEKLDHKKCMACIKIPAKIKTELKIKLARQGYTASNLFPDLDHLALDLKERHRNKFIKEKR